MRAGSPPRWNGAVLRSYPKRVEEADYSALSPVQLEQTNRMGRRGLPSTSKLQKGMINYPDFLQGHLAVRHPRHRQDLAAAAHLATGLHAHRLAVRQRISVVAAPQGHPEPGRDGRGPAWGGRGLGTPRLQGFDRIVVRAVDDLYYDNRLSDETWDQFDQFGRKA